MTHRGPFQPLLFCDSVILCKLHEAGMKPPRSSAADKLAAETVGLGRAGPKLNSAYFKLLL